VDAKGILLSGAFTPAPTATSLARAPHVERNSTPVNVRFSNFAGVPPFLITIPMPARAASGRG
jgi:catalase